MDERNTRIEAAMSALALEMLAALKDAEVALQHSLPRCDHYPEPMSRHQSALLRVRGAIAKATQ